MKFSSKGIIEGQFQGFKTFEGESKQGNHWAKRFAVVAGLGEVFYIECDEPNPRGLSMEGSAVMVEVQLKGGRFPDLVFVRAKQQAAEVETTAE